MQCETRFAKGFDVRVKVRFKSTLGLLHYCSTTARSVRIYPPISDRPVHVHVHVHGLILSLFRWVATEQCETLQSPSAESQATVDFELLTTGDQMTVSSAFSSDPSSPSSSPGSPTDRKTVTTVTLPEEGGAETETSSSIRHSSVSTGTSSTDSRGGNANNGHNHNHNHNHNHGDVEGEHLCVRLWIPLLPC